MLYAWWKAGTQDTQKRVLYSRFCSSLESNSRGVSATSEGTRLCAGSEAESELSVWTRDLWNVKATSRDLESGMRELPNFKTTTTNTPPKTLSQGNTRLWKKCQSVALSCPALCNPMGCSPPRLLCPWDSPGQNTGVGCHLLLQGIFPTPGSNPGLPR